MIHANESLSEQIASSKLSQVTRTTYVAAPSMQETHLNKIRHSRMMRNLLGDCHHFAVMPQ
jgi:hypothetical protein